MNASVKQIFKILVVDDDVRILQLLQKFLSKHGFDVSVATSANEAKKIMKQKKFDLIMLDVMMPGTSGIDFAKDIRSNDIDTPIVMLTALSDPEDIDAGFSSGANEYITKPFDSEKMLKSIFDLLDSKNDNI